MSYRRIAVAGKGGTGKTSLTGMLIDFLIQAGKGPVLAVDADPNSNLNEVLGMEADETIGDVREQVNWAEREGNVIPGGMSKTDFFKLRLNQAVLEGDGYDMLVMGRSQGEGCYCYVNGILKNQLEILSDNYNHVIIDNEAGLEHLSRGSMGKIDLLLLISDYSHRSIQAAGRVKVLAEELKMNIPKMGLIVNKAPEGKLTESILEEIQRQELELIGVIPLDSNVFDYDSTGKPLVQLPEDSPAKVALKDIMKKLQII
ncbi:AAA family ATPase [Alkalibacter rhizosphaerae]|uniref:AAA family ATPase n=1 Tax=Alkalibacter rhizosphaerae TaxID=2815577 RepID=A0A975AHT3_9FIRM|nr:AAA family ATPase [Alkalibacter rhizosphaerae]QSX08348.1 AAA family ATPase [Alkalibacter rhizosphaerae]